MPPPLRFTGPSLSPLLPDLRQRYLGRELTETERAMFDIPFEAWRVAFASPTPDYRCSVEHPVAAASLVPFDASHPVLKKIAVYDGPVTNLQLDAVVNAANEVLLGGGGVDGAIHDGAGWLLKRECAAFPGCPTGDAVITKGYNLPARYIIHTVGPIGEGAQELHHCYRNVLSLTKAHGLRTLGLCGVSVGIYGYPLRPATAIAVEEVTQFLEANPDALDVVSFACFLEEEQATTREMLRAYQQRHPRQTTEGQL